MIDRTVAVPLAPAPLFALPFTRRLIRLTAGLANPYLQRLVRLGWIPFFGIVVHRGRRSGKTYVTPVGTGMTGGYFMIPLTFGAHSNWYQNVVEAGQCTILWKGREYEAARPVVVDAGSARAAYPWPLWVLLRSLGIARFLSLSPL